MSELFSNGNEHYADMEWDDLPVNVQDALVAVMNDVAKENGLTSIGELINSGLIVDRQQLLNRAGYGN